MLITLFSQLKTLFWKQRVNLRADLASVLAVLFLPSVLLFLSSTNSGSSITSNSLELVECKIDNLLYCNYPMTLTVASDFSNEFYQDVDSVASTFRVAASNVAESLGSDFESLFVEGDEELEPTRKLGGMVTISNKTFASALWWTGENTAFAQMFVSKFNEELSASNNNIRFETSDISFDYDGGSAFDLRIGTFLLLIQIVGSQITNEKMTNMYFYMTRAGMLPVVFWSFQYIFWMIVSAFSIGITALAGLALDIEIQIGAHFVAAWFHIAFAVLLGSIFKNKKFVNMSSIIFLLGGIAVPIVFASIEQSENNETIYNGFKYIPIFYFTGDVTRDQIKIGCLISAGLTILATYLAPLFTVSAGMYEGSRVNYFYFLSPKFWTEGIVALPKHDESLSQPFYGDDNGFEIDLGKQSPLLMFDGCVKQFGKEKIIGPMNLKLEQGKITTLLGPNGVGKSTLMRVSAGYFIPSAGEMILDGKNIFRESPWSSLKSVSFCPQDNYIYENMTVDEHMLLIASFRDMMRIDDIEEHITWILTTLDIVHKRSTLAKNLSGGMKRRLCLAMSTVGFPPIILCDEPSSGVDSVSQRGIWKLLETAKQESAILLTSHSALEAVILSDSVVMMKSSEDIIQTNGKESLTFALKNTEENKIEEYAVDASNVTEIGNIIASIPNNGSEWKISSKSLAGEALPQLLELKQSNESNQNAVDGEIRVTNQIPETYNCQTPGSWRQVFILMSMVTLHVDRMFFIIVFALGINAGQIWLAYSFPTFGDIAVLILTPLVPMITFICSTIIVVQITEMLATEKSLGVSKLLFSTGITRFSYLMSYVLMYTLLSFPVSFALLVAVGSVNGTPASIFAIFCIFFSTFFMIVGICAMLGALLDARTALIAALILPSFFSIFGQGSFTKTFNNVYPGCIGQVISGLMIDDLNQTEWFLFGVSIVINMLVGTFSFYIFVLKLGNYNPFATCCKPKAFGALEKNDNDIESNQTIDENVFLEGRSIVKIYGVGEKDTASFRALDDVTFAVTNGSLLGLVGKSGAGKSTLMDVLAGQQSVTSGAVFVEGKHVFPRDISKVVSMCGQLDTIWPDMKVINAVMIFMKCRGYKVNPCASQIKDPYVRYLINELEMEDMMKKKVKVLSGGQKRRLAFLVSLMGNTKVVLVDEAMTGVDSETRKVMWKILQDEVRLRDRSVVVTSHEMSEIEQYCNTVGILHDGKLVEMGKLEDIKKKWGDSIKLICLFSSIASVSKVEKKIRSSHRNIIIKPPHVDILDIPMNSRIVATYEINLVDIQNISGLIRTMEKGLNDSTLLYWSIEPQSLDDFVRAKSQAHTDN